MDLFEFEQAIIDGQITDYDHMSKTAPFVKTVTEKHFASGTVSPKNFILNGRNQMTPMIGFNYYWLKTVIALTSYPNQKLKIFS